MFTVDERYLINLLQDGSGARLTELVDMLIRGEAHCAGVPDSSIHTNQRINVGDKGVDTAIDVGWGEHTGWLGAKSYWQYKAEGFASCGPKKKQPTEKSSLIKEFNKEHSIALTKDGYGYRFCIADSMPDAVKRRWEHALRDAKNKINPAAPDPLVVTVADVRAWLERYPALVRRYIHQGVPQLLDIESWGRTDWLTDVYVPTETSRQAAEAVVRHANLANAQPVMLSIQGPAGVGKTRCVYEALQSQAGLHPLVLYTRDERGAEDFANWLLQHRTVRAVLVVDECLQSSQYRLQSQLGAAVDRVRVIAIDNSGEKLQLPRPEHQVDRASSKEILEILERNFPAVPSEQRALYSSLAGGFVRFAAALGASHDRIVGSGIGAVLRTVDQYIRALLQNDEDAIDAICCLSLTQRVGFRQEVESEITDLCTHLQVDEKDTRQRLAVLSQNTGLVAEAGRYWYVTPRPVADWAFEIAWTKWVEPDFEAFLRRLPATLQETFRARVTESASDEIRERVGFFFRDWIQDLEPTDLTDAELVRRLALAIEASASENLSALRRIVESATHEEVLGISGSHAARGWGPRRELVWLADRLAQFSEFFPDCERILFCLATAETEGTLGNSSSRIWQQMFRILLSGTSVPFADRLQVLRGRADSANDDNRALVFGAIEEIFNTHPMRQASRPLVGGRVAPEEWRPGTNHEYRVCFDQSLGFLRELRGRSHWSQFVIDFLIGNASWFARSGYIDELRELLAPDSLRPDQRGHLLATLKEEERFRAIETEADKNRVEEWKASLVPADLRQRAMTLVAQAPWQAGFFGEEEDIAREEFRSLAEELIQEPSTLGDLVDWLGSDEAQSAFQLGLELGRIDEAVVVLAIAVENLKAECSSSFFRGYLAGILETQSPELTDRLNVALDEITPTAPAIAFEAALVDPVELRAFARGYALHESGDLPAENLGALVPPYNRGGVTQEQIQQVLVCMKAGMESGSTASVRAALRVIASSLGELAEIRASLVKTAHEVLVLSARDVRGGAHEWAQGAEVLLEADKERGRSLLGVGLASRDYHVRKEATRVVAALAKNDPATGLACLVSALERDDFSGFSRYTEIVAQIPVEVAADWLNEAGVGGAKCIARSLPYPFVDEDGGVVVPEITRHVLEAYEESDEVFENFCHGFRSGEIYEVAGGRTRQRDAGLAELLLDHPTRRIREWAEYESRWARRDAERQQREEEERF